MFLSEELRLVLLEAGAKLIGCGDISLVSADYTVGVCVAVPVPIHILHEIKDGPTKAYLDMYHELNARLDNIVKTGSDFLTMRGYEAYAQSTDVVKPDADSRTKLPHKTVATRAGLGWIGKSCLLVTPQYGSALRISSFLTNAPLEVSTPINESQCGACRMCENACPAQALKGTLWTVSTDRADIFIKDTCKKKQLELMKANTGIEVELCGKCFVVCPYTRRYIERDSS